MNQYTHAYPKEVKEKARELAVSGKSRSEISRELGVPFGTVSKWLLGINSDSQYQPEEKRKEAERMIRSGLSQQATARMLNVPIGTLVKWNIPATRSMVTYPKKTRETAIAMAGQGLDLADISRILGVGYDAVRRWTAGMNRRRRLYSGRYFLTVVDLLNSGYYVPKKNDGPLFNALRQYVPGLQKCLRDGKKTWEVKTQDGM